MLLIFFGQIGTGKTTLAKKVAEKLNYEFINFDKFMWLAINKKEMYDENDEFLLSLDEIIKVYDSMHIKAKNLLKQSKNVILESMYFKKQREEAIKLASEMNIPYILIEVICDEDIIKKRLDKRKKEYPQTPGFKLYLKYKNLLEKEDSKHIIIDTSNKNVEECAREIIKSVNN